MFKKYIYISLLALVVFGCSSKQEDVVTEKEKTGHTEMEERFATTFMADDDTYETTVRHYLLRQSTEQGTRIKKTREAYILLECDCGYIMEKFNISLPNVGYKATIGFTCEECQKNHFFKMKGRSLIKQN